MFIRFIKFETINLNKFTVPSEPSEPDEPGTSHTVVPTVQRRAVAANTAAGVGTYLIYIRVSYHTVVPRLTLLLGTTAVVQISIYEDIWIFIYIGFKSWEAR
jgi:hypothetical protein